MELNDDGPIDRVQKMLDNAQIENVLMMQLSMTRAYDKAKADAMQDFVASQNWQNGEEVTALMVCLCANFASMPLETKPKMLDNMLVTMMSLMGPMTHEIRRMRSH